MNEYRFHLQKYKAGRNTKQTCPQCGRRKCFVRYVDEEGKIEFPDYVGRCDHEDSCGYHYTPKDFFRDNPDLKPNDLENDTWRYDKTNKPVMVKPEPEVPSFMSTDMMRKTLSHYDINPLYQFLCKTIGKDAANRQFEHYKVGTSKKWGGATVFWQIDKDGNVRSGKLMGYNPKDGHRIKEPIPQVCWVHTELKLPDFHLKQCLFGEHLLATSSATIMLVESEKTCLIASHFMPDFLWLATGGKDGCFNDETIQVLHDRDVILMPDLGATEKWAKKSAILTPICKSVTVSTVLEQMATDEQREAGLDISDFLLMQETKQMILQRMIERNPALQKLIDALGLEVMDSSLCDETPTKVESESQLNRLTKIQTEGKSAEDLSSTQERRWHGRNPECHKCHLSHEGINGTYCGKLHRYVEYGKGDCGIEAEVPPAPD
jgi:hypothetical protein